MFLGSFVPIAFTEELIFRGFVLDRFLVKGPVLAIIASSILSHRSTSGTLVLGGLGFRFMEGLSFYRCIWGLFITKPETS